MTFIFTTKIKTQSKKIKLALKIYFDGDIIEYSIEDETGVYITNGSSIQRWNNLLFIFTDYGLTIYDICQKRYNLLIGHAIKKIC